MQTVLHQTTTTSPEAMSQARSNRSLYIGYYLLSISCFVFALAEMQETEADQLALFFLHYAIALIYAIYLISKKAYGIRRSWQNEHQSKTMVLFHLFLISAYALNREISVFEDSTPWLCAYIVMASAVLLGYPYLNSYPRWLKRVQFFLTGSVLMFYLYLSLYTLKWYGFGLIGTLFIGIGAHIFVPICLLALGILVVGHHARTFNHRLWVIAGAGLTLLFCVAFAVEWVSRVESMERITNNSVLTPHDDLPVWVRVAQRVQDDWITQRALRSDLVYTTWDRYMGNMEFIRRRAWNEKRKHDPLVFIGSVFAKNSLSQEDRIKILQTNITRRNAAEERLWSGDNLSTSFVVSDIDIYPALRMAYTEKYLSIRNSNPPGSWWGNTQEAIYTFQLPEGSVITSLSLWVEGVEEKAMLTSKQKATEAYQTIVGVEQRDPSVVHWQEGNTVSVRVFPCTPDEDRKFRLGITSPLQEKNGKLVYGNITFEGPSPSAARETMRIRFLGGETIRQIPQGFKKNEKGQFIREDVYDPDFDFTLSAIPLAENRFSFQGYQYSIERSPDQFDSLSAQRIYLDINQSWTDKELKQLKPLLEQYSMYTLIDSENVRLTHANWIGVTSKLLQDNFSVFPFYKLPEHALVITKGSKHSPHVSDLKKSSFAKHTSEFFASGRKVYVFDLGDERGNYLNTLRELRALHYAKGSVDQLKEYLFEKKYPFYDEHENQVYLHDAGLWIERKPVGERPLPDNAPDHVARLFAYNNIMRKAGEHYFNHDLVQEALVKEASQANVVSPVSSLIVLEKKADYERFNIEESKDSLGNAKKQSSGAVPEPHEWALIILFLLLVLYTTKDYLRKKLSL